MDLLKTLLQEVLKVSLSASAIVVVNPGNPSGSVLTRDNMEDIVEFAYRHKLFLMADEVYQQNIWAEGMEFVSFKKVWTCWLICKVSTI